VWQADRVVGENGLVEGLWRQQSIWSQTANRMKASIGRARSAALALTLGGAVLATLATRLSAGQAGVGSVRAVAAAVGVGLVPVLPEDTTGQCWSWLEIPFDQRRRLWLVRAATGCWRLSG
jgi:hypothetical protein